MLTMRELTGDGFGRKEREWNGKDVLEGWRERWADQANRALERFGHEARVDHRSYADQGIDREAQPKLGAAAAMERRGEVTERGDELRQVEARNAERAGLARQLDVVREALQVVRERAAEALHRGAERAHEVYEAAKERVNALLGRAEEPAAREAPSADREAVLGRAAEAVENRAEPIIDRAALLGQVAREAPGPAPDRDALLGRSDSAPKVAEADRGDKDRDDGGRDR